MIIVPHKNAVLLRMRDPSVLTGLLPSKLIDYERHNVAVRYGIDEVRVLRNMGIDVPPPIVHKYVWPGRFTPFPHQITTAGFITLNPQCFVLNEMGTGKSSSVLWAADHLMNMGEVRKALIVAPLSTLERVWRDEIFSTLMHRTATVLHGSKDRRLDRLDNDVDFYIINHEGLGVVLPQLMARKDIDMVIVDEAADYRNHATTRYQHLRKLLRRPVKPRLVMMTGAPCPNAPTDAWALAKLVRPELVPEFFSTFRRQTMQQVTQYKWVPKPEAYDLAFAAMQPGIRFKKADVLKDLPPVVVLDRDVLLTPEQAREYRFMKRQMAIDLAGAGGISTVTAVNAADQITKLRQILCGTVRIPNTDEYVTIDHAPRVQALLDSIAQASAKVLVVVPFKGITNSLHAEVSKHYSCEVVNGDVSIKERNAIFSRFRADADPHVLLCHPKVMSHGLTLTEADVLIFYAPIYSNDQYQQVKDRFNRPGQSRSMTIIRIGGEALEWSIYQALDGKQLTQSRILEMYKNELAAA